MAEYIEREAAYEDFEKCNSENPKWTPSRVKTLIARQKAADIAPVRHGKWIKRKSWNFHVCSECSFETSPYMSCMNYCPNCGAKMDGGINHEI